MRFGYILFCLLSLINVAAAQQKNVPGQAAVRVVAKPYGDSVVLRWAPTTGLAWEALNHSGYLIERLELHPGADPLKQLLTSVPLKPKTLEQFKQLFAPGNLYAATAAQCLYGKNAAGHIRPGVPGVADQADVLTSRYAFTLQVCDFDPQVASAAALRYVDKQVKPGGVYIYRIYPAAALTMKVDTGIIIVKDSAALTRTTPVLSAVLGRDRTAELHWSRSQPDFYTAYDIERSEDGQHFIKLNNKPFISPKPDPAMVQRDSIQARMYLLLEQQMVFMDSLPQNYHTYHYRIRGINPFGEWSDYSATLTIQGRDLTPPPAPVLQNPKYVTGRSIRLSWKQPAGAPDLKGYYVTRAHTITGPFITLTDKLLSPGINTYTDDSAFIHGSNYYIIAAIDTAGNISSSFAGMGIVPDTTPPAPPVGLAGTIDKQGHVRLHWNRNKEEDAAGYKVYFANNPRDYYSQVTGVAVADTTYTDSITLETLSKDIWYKIAAVDENGNHSRFSAAVKLRRPDIVPPVPPLASKVYVDTAGVQIVFIASSSPDAARYIIYRKTEKSGWEQVAAMPHIPGKDTLHFTDRQLKPLVAYTYCAETIDEDSLHSAKSSPVNAMIKTLPLWPAITTLQVKYNDKTGVATLQWQHHDQGSYFYVLYRAKEGQPLVRFASAAGDAAAFADALGKGVNGNVRYAIQVMYSDGRGAGAVSTPVVVK
ncbi:fibronectin type III domain-containing protein [Chitinophaga sp. Cy-1792]|uniref:fibronectin type III domain-containing protein n=1 Tax=Chitinophaga sp. Cy-1792 TaxID=2608339 RepID=UPI0014207F28|nr:hypothetical protein [Chitinophaga sp. Cy-1792]NIG56417.1 hypothetical protein [Chitinophaga sp. Cy-1792]